MTIKKFGSSDVKTIKTTMNAISDLGGFYYNQGKFHEADLLFKERYDMANLLLGENDPFTVVCKKDWRKCLKKKGK